MNGICTLMKLKGVLEVEALPVIISTFCQPKPKTLHDMISSTNALLLENAMFSARSGTCLSLISFSF
jgi:hypothetical protein